MRARDEGTDKNDFHDTTDNYYGDDNHSRAQSFVQLSRLFSREYLRKYAPLTK